MTKWSKSKKVKSRKWTHRTVLFGTKHSVFVTLMRKRWQSKKIQELWLINVLLFRCKLEVVLLGSNPNGNQFNAGQLMLSQPEGNVVSKETKIWRDMLLGRSTNLLHWLQLHEPNAWAFFFLFFLYKFCLIRDKNKFLLTGLNP